MVARDYVLLTLFWKFHNLAQPLCHCCSICTRPSRIGQRVEQQNWNRNNIVSDHHGWIHKLRNTHRSWPKIQHEFTFKDILNCSHPGTAGAWTNLAGNPCLGRRCWTRARSATERPGRRNCWGRSAWRISFANGRNVRSRGKGTFRSVSLISWPTRWRVRL